MTETVNHTEEITLQAQSVEISSKGTIEHNSQYKKRCIPQTLLDEASPGKHAQKGEMFTYGRVLHTHRRSPDGRYLEEKKG